MTSMRLCLALMGPWLLVVSSCTASKVLPVEPAEDSDVATDSDTTAVDTDLSSQDTDPSPDTDSPSVDTDGPSDTGGLPHTGGPGHTGAPTPLADTGLICGARQHSPVDTGGCLDLQLPWPAQRCDLTCALDRLLAEDAVSRTCRAMESTCTNACGRDLIVHTRDEQVTSGWPYLPSVVTLHVTEYFDARNGDYVATHQQGPIIRCADRWIGDEVLGCTPSPPKLVGCDTGDLCDVLEDRAVLTTAGPPCDGWPGGRSVIGSDPLDLSGTVDQYGTWLRNPQLYPAGDLTGDGVDDLLVLGRHGARNKVLLFAGGAGLLDAPLMEADAATILDSSATVGWGAFATGDFDGDGARDLALGDDDYQNNSGGVWIFRGPITSPALDAGAADIVLTAGFATKYTGRSLVNVGDVDADGDDDLVVNTADGAVTRLHVLDIDASTQGAVLLETLSSWWSVGADASARYLGDLDGDGDDDLGFTDPDAAQRAGSISLVRGPIASGAGDLTGLPAKVVLGPPVSGANFAGDLASVDLDHDGVPELLVADVHQLWTIVGWPKGGNTIDKVASARLWKAWDTPTFVDETIAFATPGDLDGDGIDDVVVGLPDEGLERTCHARPYQRRELTSQQGAAVLVSGTTLDGEASVLATGALLGPQLDEHLANAVRDLGDVNDDGTRDVIVSNTAYEPEWWVLPACGR